MIALKFILASESPRRRALLKQAGIPCETVSSGADETLPCVLPPDETVKILSGRKADAALALREWERPSVLIAADTVVYLDGKILGKPSNRAEAAEMLRMLQGRTHTVYTGVAIRYLRGSNERGLNEQRDIVKSAEVIEQRDIVETAEVTMRSLTPEEIARYVSTGEPDDKAGAYGAQGLGSALVAGVKGDFHTVVGLPLARLCEAFKSLGIDYTAHW